MSNLAPATIYAPPQMAMVIQFDELTDVVSAFVASSVTARTKQAPHDRGMLLDFSSSGEIVGVEILGASCRAKQVWSTHPDRACLPTDLLTELDRWLAQHWSSEPRQGADATSRRSMRGAFIHAVKSASR